MGFYGNITNTANTTFSFDIVYSTREALDANCDTDGVFLGRYVLVDYDDQEVIKAYFIEGQFYNKPRPNLEGDKADKPLDPRLGVIYQALNVTSDTGDLMFYKWNKDTKQYQVVTAADKADTPYVSNFRADVEKYGRGYDSTAWVKHYDPVKNKYQYVMVAELNAAVPTFHLVTDPPTPLPTTPYIDRDTTNLDYYLHQQSNYGFRVNAVKAVNEETDPKDALYNENDVGYSDEKVTRNTIEYTVNNSGYQDFGTKSENVWLDIFYNNKGFQEDIHTNITDLKDEIGYSFSSSGRKYGNLPLPNSAITADDTVDWHIRLPGIGNAICRMWDRFYGNRADNKRYLNFAQKREDTESNLVTYDQNTVIGIINTARDMLGYYFLPISALNTAKDENKESITETNILGSNAVSSTVTAALEYNKGNVSKDQSIDYPILKCLYYKPATEKEPIKYYHYVYTPTHDPIGADVDPEELDKTINYYYYDENTKIYHIANPEAYNYDNANNVKIKTVYYTRTDGWTLTEIEQGDNLFENSIYGLITEIHTLLGTDTKDTRDLNNLQGCINIIRDIVESLNLAPGKLLYTNAKGQIATSDTYFPSAKWDADEVLSGDGKWVSRFSQVTILKNSENANQDESKVNNIVNGVEDEDIVAAVLISDNDKTNDGGTEIVQNNKHTANNLTFGTRNKWIKLYGDPEDDSLEFKHQESPIITRLRAEESTGSTYVKMHNTIQDDEGKETIKVTAHGNVDIYDATGYGNFSAVEDIENHIAEIKVEPTTNNLSYDSRNPDANDNRLTIPYLTVDNAGHIVELGTKNFNIPHGFKKIETTAIEITDESVSSDKPGISIAESISDTLELAPKNRWIDIATEVDNNEEGSAKDNNAENPKADKITFGHRLVPTLEENVTLNGERRTQKTEIETVYRYGLPQDKTIGENGNLDKQNENEAANTFNVPYIEVDKAGHIVAAETHTVKLPENFTTITLSKQDESTTNEANTTTNDVQLQADTLTDNLTLKTVNRWIGLGLTDNDNNDIITFGHRLSDIKNVSPLTLNGDRKADQKYEKVYRYGLPQNKSVSDLEEDFGGYNKNNEKIIDSALMHEKAHTFNVPYIEIDEAGHIVHAETHTIEVPRGYSKISTGSVINDEAASGEAGHTKEDSAAKVTGIIAETLEEEIVYAPSNKWIRINAINGNGQDTITFGHEIHDIIVKDPDDPSQTQLILDLNESDQKSFYTIDFNYDDAGHIISKTGYNIKLPYGYKTFAISNTNTSDKIDITNGASFITAASHVDSMKFAAGNKWIQLIATNSDETNQDVITIAHQVIYDEEKTAIGWLGTDLSKEMVPAANTFQIAAFGDTIVCQGYKIDKAGHIIDDPVYSFTLPKGSYIPDDKTDPNGARVITGIGFTDSSGEITSTSETVGALTLMEYGDATTTISANFTINEAFAALDNRIDNLTIKINETSLKAMTGTDVFTIGSNSGIVLTASEENNSFIINHKSGTVESIDSNKLYKFNLDSYGHISSITEASAADIGLDKVENKTVDEILANAELTGIPTAPTADKTIQTTQLATTKYVHDVVAEMLKSFDISLHDFIVNTSEDNGSFIITIPEKQTYSALEEYTYQWQQSANGQMGWTEITGATSNTYTPTQPNFYRCRVTKTCCGLEKTISSDVKEFKAS